MASYNTGSDSANTAVRAFLTKVGEYYLNKENGEARTFNTSKNGSGHKVWNNIKIDFDNSCAYCGKKGKGENEQGVRLEIEHLIMFNRQQCGLHHPGNIVPVCSSCNKRGADETDRKKNIGWEEQLKRVGEKEGQALEIIEERRNKIKNHMKKYKYPDLSQNELKAIKVIANSLYENIKGELKKSLELYKDLNENFVD